MCSKWGVTSPICSLHFGLLIAQEILEKIVASAFHRLGFIPDCFIWITRFVMRVLIAVRERAVLVFT
jgi:hypothetical protein